MGFFKFLPRGPGPYGRGAGAFEAGGAEEGTGGAEEGSCLRLRTSAGVGRSSRPGLAPDTVAVFAIGRPSSGIGETGERERERERERGTRNEKRGETGVVPRET